MSTLEFAALVGAFAGFVTAHVSIVWGLLFVQPRWHAVVALVVCPIAPFWGIQSGMHVRSAVWLVALTGYVVAQVLVGR